MFLLSSYYQVQLPVDLMSDEYLQGHVGLFEHMVV